MWHTLSIDETRRNLRTNIKIGLTQEEVEKRREEFGENQLEDKKKESLIIKFLKQFNDFMIIILIIASIISAAMATLEGSNEYIDSIIIIGIVIFNAIMGLVQEAKAEKSLEALKKMSAPIAKVKRDGKNIQVKSEQIVPGDIIILEAGGYVPADCRLIKSSNLKIEEAALTGENLPVEKDAQIVLKKDISLGDTINMAFATTIVVNGHAEAIVTETGMNTKVGKIAKMIISDEAPETPIQKKLSEVGKTLGIGCLLICLAIFIIGIFKKIAPIEMFMTSVGLAVAAIPEGLPAIVTIMLSIGVTKMAKKNAIIRKLPAVETLGSSSVICSDKTGTLTQNKMKVVEVVDANGKVVLENEYKFILGIASMCTDCEIEYEKQEKVAKGEATEIAIVNEALRIGENKEELYSEYRRINDIPFDSTRKLMTTIHKFGDQYRIITKGAPDVLLNRCKNYYYNNKTYELTNNIKQNIIKQNMEMANKALRVLAVAFVDLKKLPDKLDTKTIENNLTFVSLIGMIDPPRIGVKEAVTTCKKAGIKTVMITGDHILTAKAIAKQLGILKQNDIAITGEELEKIPQDKLEENIMRYSVFARVSPEHKVRIVKAFQSTKAVVAMTGDGVNDAPALKSADIGIAMGLNGTDVAKNAADMILTDDNFITIVEAVKQGRNIFDNIKKAVHFLIATNIGEIVTIFTGLLLGLKTPLLAIQLLWINLVTDSIPAIALGLEKPEKDIMNKKPRDSKKGIFSDGLWSKIFVEGIMLGVLTLFAFSLGNNLYGVETGRTMAFVSLGLLELVHSFNIKSEESIFKIGFFENKYLVGALILGSVLQIGVVCIPQIASIFKLVALDLRQWIYVGLISIAPIIIIEIQKKFNEIKFGKTVYGYKEKINY
ncbi:MAG: calcium-translocating P-type ATPase, PMCA-type [Clostridia bacterium]|jgi:Ca2+-transporting ATPase|nr:calcium-translocating P-type ATPase, PMCA-type [Clostridia bacterium]